MSYETTSGGNTELNRNSGTLGVTSCFWVRYFEFVDGGDPALYAVGNGDDWSYSIGDIAGSGIPVITDTCVNTQGGNLQIVSTGSDSTWIFVCTVAVNGVGVTAYWRHEGENFLHTSNVSDTNISTVNQFFLVGTGGGSTNHKRFTAYKEWSTSAALTPDQIFAESQQNAPIVTTGLTNYLQCDAGHTIGHDQSAAAQNWTVTGTTLTISTDEPNMLVSRIEIRGAATVSASSGVCNKPTEVVAGDVLVAWLGNYNSAFVSLWASTGWTVLAATSERGGPGGSDLNCAMMYKVAGASESSSYTFTATGTAGNIDVIICAYSGVNNTTPFDNFSVNNSGGANSTVTGTGFSAAKAKEYLVYGWFGDDNALTAAPSGSAGSLISRVDGTSFLNLDSGFSGYYDGALVSSGSTGNYVTSTGGADTWIVIMAALNPATINYRASSTASSLSGATISAVDPGQAGDFLLAVWECDGGGQTCSPPDGTWTQIFNASLTITDGATYYVWYKKSAVGSGSYIFTPGITLNQGLVISAWSGVHPTTPLQVTPVSETHDDDRATPASVIAPTLTTTANGCQIVWVGVADPGTSTPTTVDFVPPSGYVERVAFADTSGWDIICVADNGQGTAAVVPSATGTFARPATGFGVVGFHIALAPASSGTLYDVDAGTDTPAITDTETSSTVYLRFSYKSHTFLD